MKAIMVRSLKITYMLMLLMILMMPLAYADDTLQPAIDIADEAIGYLKNIGTVLAVAVLGVYGIKWFFANSNTKADLKERAWVYIAGAVLVYAGTHIASWVVTLLQGIIIYPVVVPPKEATNMIILMFNK